MRLIPADTTIRFTTWTVRGRLSLEGIVRCYHTLDGLYSVLVTTKGPWYLRTFHATPDQIAQPKLCSEIEQ